MATDDVFSGCTGPEEDKEDLTGSIRKAAFAGRFYPSDARALRQTLDEHFSRTVYRDLQGIRALIVPHAGYVYSGDVAAQAYAQIEAEGRFDTIVILVSSHRCAFPGASIDRSTAYQTPLGTVPVNLELSRKLMSEHPGLFSFREEAHSAEHSLEVQLPFLQYRLKHPFRILPIVIGSQDREQCRALAEALRPLFVPENLFIISTDFSHYPPGDEARKADARTAEAIAKNDPEALVDVLAQNRRMNIPGLATSLCGWSSVLCLLHLSRELADGSYHLLKYQHSGEKAYGDKKEVVGYWAIAFTGPSKTGDDATFHLSREEKDALLMIARQTLEMELSDKDWTPERDALPPALLEARGVFVSLKKQGRLRGCIGRFDAKAPLYLGVQQMAIAAATRDTRFKALTSEELNEINIEISVLGPLRKVRSVNEIQPGRHGIYIRKGSASGTFLPQVATETGWTLKELLGHCARDKAGIGWEGWKEAEIYVYKAEVFSELEVRS